MKKIVIAICVFVFFTTQILASGTIKWISKTKGQVGQTLTNVKVASNTGTFNSGGFCGILFCQGSNVVFYSGFTEANSNGDTLTFSLPIPKWVSPGVYDIDHDYGGNGRLSNGFTVTSSRLKTTPSSATIGNKITVDISGLKTNFTNTGLGTKVWLKHEERNFNQDSSSIFQQIILKPASVSIKNKTTLSCNFTLPDTLKHGTYDLYVKDSTDGTLTDYSNIEITGKVIGIYPDSGKRGHQINVTITGIRGSFDTSHLPDSTQTYSSYLDANFVGYSQGTSTSFYADSVTYLSSDTILASFLIPETLDEGKCDLYLLCGYTSKYNSYVDYYYLGNKFTVHSFGAEFSSSSDKACPNSSIKFTDLSDSGNHSSINKWNWDFGDGTTDTFQNPKHTFTSIGTYPVKLIIKTADGYIDSVLHTIIIDSFTFPSFLCDNVVCTNEIFQCINASRACFGKLSYLWDFGDGVTDTAQDPKHQYSKVGNYTVTLKTTSTTGKPGIVTRGIKVSDQLKVMFSVIDTSCLNAPVQFYNSSSLCSGTMTYEWNFGDGSIDTAKNPRHKYNKDGVYFVKLKIFSSGGSVDFFTQQTVVTTRADAKFSSISSGCLNVPFQFLDSSTVCTGTLRYFWDFGDGGSDTIKNPLHKFSKNGIYTVKLKILSSGGSIDSMKKTIHISNLPKANFTTLIPNCLNAPIHFVDSSNVCSGPLKYLWSFHDATTDTVQNPIHLYKLSGNFTVKLKIQSDDGSIDSIEKRISVDPAPKAIISSPNLACVNSRVQYLELATAHYYLWSFGDGDTSNQKNPSHVYTKPGTYKVMLKVGYTGGCEDSMSKSIIVSPEPLINWKITSPKVRDIDFVALDTNFKSYLWDFGDSITSTSFHQLHTYKKDGVYDVKLIVEDSFGCTSEKDTQITIANTSLQKNANFNSLKVSPNPFSSSFNISFNLSSTQRTIIQLCDLDGRVINEVYNGMLKEGRNELQVSCPLPSGIYMLRLVTKEGVMTSRVVKME